MINLICVFRPDRFDGDASLACLVLDLTLETGERPCVETTIHLLAVVETFAYLRQVFEDGYWLLELPSVLDCLPGHLLDNVYECVLVVVESLVKSLLGGIML